MALFIWCSLQLLLSSFCLSVCDTLFSITTFSCAWLSASYTFKRTVHGGSILLPLSKFPGLWCSSILGQDNFLSVSYWCHNPHLPIFCVSGLQSNKICLEFLFQLGWWPSVTCTSHRQFFPWLLLFQAELEYLLYYDLHHSWYWLGLAVIACSCKEDQFELIMANVLLIFLLGTCMHFQNVRRIQYDMQ